MKQVPRPWKVYSCWQANDGKPVEAVIYRGVNEAACKRFVAVYESRDLDVKKYLADNIASTLRYRIEAPKTVSAKTTPTVGESDQTANSMRKKTP